ncbi:MAG: APC family permease [Nocardioidaceae bacterium]
MTTNTEGLDGSPMRRVLTWRDGFRFAINIAIGLFLTLGYTIGAIGTWLTIGLWLVAGLVAFLQNHLFAEMAALFRNRSGGIPVYAYEGWKSRLAPLGAIATFGYWMGWSFSLSVESSALGLLVQQAFFPDFEWHVHIANQEIGLPHLIAIACLAVTWALNYFGVKITRDVVKVIATLYLIGLATLVIGTFSSPTVNFDIARLSLQGSPGWRELVVWFYVTAWTIYGTGMCATFAPEYKDPVRDTSKALKSSAMFMLALYFIVPLTVAGSLGEKTIGANPITYIGIAFDQILGGFGWLGTLPIIASFLISMMTATADGGRALYGIAQSGSTIRQLGVLNRYGVPGRALTLDAVLNTFIIVFLGAPISILLASNLGYILAMTLAIGAFVLLRRDHPEADRPIRLRQTWIYVAVVLFSFNLFVLVVGIASPGLAGYGGLRDTLTGLGVLLVGVVLFAYRQKVQDRGRIRWRVKDEALPTRERTGVNT